MNNLNNTEKKKQIADGMIPYNRKIYRVAGYVRLSDEDRVKQHNESESIINQKSLLKSHIEEQANWILVDFYVDDDCTGTNEDREGFRHLIEDCRNGKIDIVLCKSQSRFSRELEKIEKYLHKEFLEWGVRFVSIVDKADTSVKENKKSRQINGLINEWYSEDLSDSIIATLDALKEQGLFVGSFAPYGYMKDSKDKHHLIIDIEVCEVIKTIFKMYLDGFGYSVIARHLTERGIPTPAKYKMIQGNYKCGNANSLTIWNKDTIRKFLMDETYIGSVVQSKGAKVSYKSKKRISKSKNEWIIVKDKHEAIIDKETWDTVRDMFKTHNKRTSYDTGKTHVFSKKVYCNECGKSMARNSGSKKYHDYTYLRCRRKSENPLTCINSGSIRYDYLEGIILDEIRKLIKKYSDDKLIEKVIAQQLDLKKEQNKRIEEINYQISFYETQLNKKKNVLKELYQDKVEGIITSEEFVELKKDIAEEKENIQSTLIAYNSELEGLKVKNSSNIDLKDIIKKYKNIKILTNQTLDIFIEKIYVSAVNEETGKRDILIEWKI